MLETWQKRDDPRVVVAAVRLNEENVSAVCNWAHGDPVEEIDPEHPEETRQGFNLITSSGSERASLGMYVVQYGRHFFVSHVRPFEEKYIPRDRPAPPPESAGDARRQRGFSDPFDQGRRG